MPVAKAGDAVDFSQLLHRDGTVMSVVDVKELAQPELLYRKLGAEACRWHALQGYCYL